MKKLAVVICMTACLGLTGCVALVADLVGGGINLGAAVYQQSVPDCAVTVKSDIAPAIDIAKTALMSADAVITKVEMAPDRSSAQVSALNPRGKTRVNLTAASGQTGQTMIKIWSVTGKEEGRDQFFSEKIRFLISEKTTAANTSKSLAQK